jgi:hypothetical protein
MHIVKYAKVSVTNVTAAQGSVALLEARLAL